MKTQTISTARLSQVVHSLLKMLFPCSGSDATITMELLAGDRVYLFGEEQLAEFLPVDGDWREERAV